jgi:hypothetical protein
MHPNGGMMLVMVVSRTAEAPGCCGSRVPGSRATYQEHLCQVEFRDGASSLEHLGAVIRWPWQQGGGQRDDEGILLRRSGPRGRYGAQASQDNHSGGKQRSHA